MTFWRGLKRSTCFLLQVFAQFSMDHLSHTVKLGFVPMVYFSAFTLLFQLLYHFLISFHSTVTNILFYPWFTFFSPNALHQRCINLPYHSWHLMSIRYHHSQEELYRLYFLLLYKNFTYPLLFCPHYIISLFFFFFSLPFRHLNLYLSLFGSSTMIIRLSLLSSSSTINFFQGSSRLFNDEHKFYFHTQSFTKRCQPQRLRNIQSPKFHARMLHSSMCLCLYGQNWIICTMSWDHRLHRTCIFHSCCKNSDVCAIPSGLPFPPSRVSSASLIMDCCIQLCS